MQFAVYGLMNPYTYQRPKITPLPNETGLTVPGGTGVAVVPNGTAPALKQPYLPGQYTEYPAAVQGLAQQALPGGGSGIEGGLDTSIKNIDEFIGGNKSFDDVLDDYIAFYQDRIRRGLQVDRSTCPYNEEMLKDRKAICRNMLTNPFEKFERKRFLYYSKDLSVIAMNHALYSQMGKEDWDKVKTQLQEDLKNYYSEMGGI